MPKPGWSNETIIKPEILAEIGELLFSIVGKIHARNGSLTPTFPFTYLDLTGGPGLHEGDVGGAAAIFHSMLQECSFAWVMHVIEERAGEYRKLQSLFIDEPDVHCHRGASETIAPHILGSLRYSPFGLICLDPNGCGMREQRIIKMVAACPQTRRMDWLLHLASRTIKRVRRCQDTQFDLELADLISLTGKRRALIKRSPSGTKHDWVYLFLTSADDSTIRQWKKRGWYDVGSIEGRQVFRSANYTIDELKAQDDTWLF
jgi:hypothetical protein